jgi:hypothetical protein
MIDMDVKETEKNTELQKPEEKVVDEKRKNILYKTSEIARKLRMSHLTVLNWIKTKQLDARKGSTGQYRISEDSLQRFLQTPYRERFDKKKDKKTKIKIEKIKEDEEDWLF